MIQKLFRTALMVLLLINFSNAQPVLSSVNIPTPGAIWANKTITDTSIQPGPSGMNQIWNFSSYFVNPSVISEIYSTPTGTSNDLLFPSANLKATSVFGTEDYFIRSSSELQYLGTKSNTIELIITNVQKLLTVPFQFLDSVSNSPVTGTGYLGYPIEGNISTHADGTGSLTLFTGAFSSTLRVVTEINLTEAPGTGLDTYVHIIKYSWYTTTYRAPVFQIAILDIDGPLGSTHQKVTTVSTLTTDIQNPAQPQINFSIAPNPASKKINVSLSAAHATEAKLKIFDMNSRLIRQDKTELKAGTQDITLDISTLPKGVYFLSVYSGATFSQQRFIVE